MQGEFDLEVNLQGSGCQFLSRNTSNKVSHMERKKTKLPKKKKGKNKKHQLIWLEQKNKILFWKLEASKPFPNTIFVIRSQHKC